MSILSKIQESAFRVVSFPTQGLAFKVRSITSADLAEVQVAGLMAAAGKRSDPEREALTVAVLDAKKALEAYQDGEAPAADVARASQALAQLRAYSARAMGPEKARAAAERNEGLAMAGVVAVTDDDGKTWTPCQLSRDEETMESPDLVVLNVRDVAPFIPDLASGVVSATLKEGEAKLAPFPGGAGATTDPG